VGIDLDQTHLKHADTPFGSISFVDIGTGRDLQGAKLCPIRTIEARRLFGDWKDLRGTARQQPVCFSHCLPAALKAHPRNKSDEELRLIADRGGFVGVTMFPPFLPKGPDSTVDDYVAAIEHVIGLVGEDAVGIGTDFTQGYGKPFFDWITHDKGHGRKLTDFGEIRNPAGMDTIGDYPNLIAAMHRAGWTETRIDKVMGNNWLHLLETVWGE
jgi:membrane dipeptidase